MSLNTYKVVNTQKPESRDSMNAAGSNAQMHEDLLAGGDDTLHRDGLIGKMREAGCKESTLDLLRNPQPL